MKNLHTNEEVKIAPGVVFKRRVGRVQRAANRVGAIEAMNSLIMKSFPKWEIDEELLEEAIFEDRKPWKHDQLTRAAKELLKTTKFTPKLVELLAALDKILAKDLNELKRKAGERSERKQPRSEEEHLGSLELTPSLVKRSDDIEEGHSKTFAERRQESEKLQREWLEIAGGVFCFWAEVGRVTWGNKRWLTLMEGEYLNAEKVREVGALIREDYMNGVRCPVEMPTDEVREAAEQLVRSFGAYEQAPLYAHVDDF